MNTVHAHRSPVLSTSAGDRPPPHPVLDEVLRAVVAIGAVLLILVPEARGVHPQLGWLPLWLLGMPLIAWWAAHRFRLPGRAVDDAERRPSRPLRRRLPQARRRVRPRAPVGGLRTAA